MIREGVESTHLVMAAEIGSKELVITKKGWDRVLGRMEEREDDDGGAGGGA